MFQTATTIKSLKISSATFKEEVRACVDIMAGEEITISYRNQMQENFLSREQRVLHLKQNFGFICTCSLCQDGPVISSKNDDLRREAFNLRKRLLSSNSMSPAELMKLSIKWLSLMTEAKFSIDYHLDAIYLCCQAASGLNNTRALKHWSSRGESVALITRGPSSKNFEYFRKKLEMF